MRSALAEAVALQSGQLVKPCAREGEREQHEGGISELVERESEPEGRGSGGPPDDERAGDVEEQRSGDAARVGGIVRVGCDCRPQARTSGNILGSIIAALISIHPAAKTKNSACRVRSESTRAADLRGYGRRPAPAGPAQRAATAKAIDGRKDGLEAGVPRPPSPRHGWRRGHSRRGPRRRLGARTCSPTRLSRR